MTTTINKNVKSSNVKSEVANTEVAQINNSYPWNNIDKSAKNWNTPKEQAFQSFRFEIFNRNGDKHFHPFLFNMLLDTYQQTLANKAQKRTEFGDHNMGFQISSERFLMAYSERIIASKVDKSKYSSLFTETELIDIKSRLHFHMPRYWRRIGMPGFTSKRFVKVAPAVVATAADFKKNDAVDAFLSNLK